ncbi:hypothetical protein BU17DRAFT_36968 [Hysterangium stoloniferum]|nr:hypothetical protein BU17DRAFT_36968 [Hysterangium stoloniferum]
MVRRCPICRSRQWHKEAASGLVTCSEGHVLQNYRNETRETTELGPHALRKRTLKSGRVRKDDTGKGDAALYHGARARYLYFESLQLILRAQIRVLIQEWKLPLEFEVICKDIWALHLSLLPRPPDPEWAMNEAHQGHGDPTGSASGSDSGPDDQGDWTLRDDGDKGEKQDEKDETEAILDDLLKEAEATPGSDGDTDSDGGTRANRKGNRTAPEKKKRNTYEAPAGNIAVLMMGCWTIRLPVMYRDFVRLIEAYKLPYLDGVRVLPGEMRRHLAKETVSMLNPHFPPTVLKLHRLTSRLVRLCWTRFGIHTPEVNGGPMLWRIVRALKGTATLYGLAKSMARELYLPLTLDVSLAPGLVPRRQGDPRRHKGDNVPVEVGLVGVVIVVLKMVYGLDGVKRRVMDGDPGSTLPGLEMYIEMVRAGEGDEDEELFSECGKMINVATLENEEIDKYLEFCEGALLGNEGGDKSTDYMGRSGPLDVAKEENSTRQGTTTKASRVKIEVYDGSAEEDPGRIRIYKATDTLGRLPAPFNLVLEAGATFSGVPIDKLARVVERFERRLK